MIFKIEIDEECITEDNIKYEIAQEVASKIYSSLNLETLKNQANKELEKKKEDCLKNIKSEIHSWDKAGIVLELQTMMEKNWINNIAEKVVEKLRCNSDFVSKVSSEIIKSNFK